MVRDDQLPEGVPASNDEKPAAKKQGAASFAAPDMATPQFPREMASETSQSTDKRDHRVLRSVDDAQSFESASSVMQKASRSKMLSTRQTILFAGILILLGVLGAGAMLSRAGPTPLCAEQPDWNQYNCRAF